MSVSTLHAGRAVLSASVWSGRPHAATRQASPPRAGGRATAEASMRQGLLTAAAFQLRRPGPTTSHRESMILRPECSWPLATGSHVTPTCRCLCPASLTLTIRLCDYKRELLGDCWRPACGQVWTLAGQRPLIWMLVALEGSRAVGSLSPASLPAPSPAVVGITPEEPCLPGVLL